MASHKFTNCYRAADRVSQYLINEVIYRGSQDAGEVLFRILLFRFFNRISTWRLLHTSLGQLTRATFRVDRYDEVLKAPRSKYALEDEQRPFVGNRSARFKAGVVEIVVDAPHLSFDMAVLYATPAFRQQMKAQQRREQDAERRRDAASF